MFYDAQTGVTAYYIRFSPRDFEIMIGFGKQVGNIGIFDEARFPPTSDRWA